MKTGIMPGRCALNGLQTEPLSDELKGIDPFSSQVIQLAKAFQTVSSTWQVQQQLTTIQFLESL